MKNIENFEQLLNIAKSKNKRILDVIIELECDKTESTKEKLFSVLNSHLDDIYNSIQNGLNSNKLSASGMSGQDTSKVNESFEKRQKSAFNTLSQNIIKYALAIAEENQRMGKIVACPTAGSCGILPAVIVSYAEKFEISYQKQLEALTIAGFIGKIISEKVALAGAVAGCQAECGVASAMAAASATYLVDGNDSQIINSAALALKNVLGLTCDPIAGLVEVPCIKRNAFFAIHSITASELAICGVESVIPLDEVVIALKQTGNLMSPLLKECSQAGLAVVKTAKTIEEKLLGHNI